MSHQPMGYRIIRMQLQNALKAVPRPCIVPTTLSRLSSQGHLASLHPSSRGVNHALLLSRLSASHRQASTGTGNPRPPTPRSLEAKPNKKFNVLEKLQALSNGNGPDIVGSIVVGDNEGLLFFDNIFPRRASWWDFRAPLLRLASYIPESYVPKYIPSNFAGFKLLSTYFQPKDGGAFVKFAYDPKITNPRAIESTVQSHLKHAPVRPWFSPLHPVRAFLVEGVPWIEDLDQFPSSRLKVEFVAGPQLSQESLYNLFRRFGKIKYIIRQSGESKEVPKWAIVQFSRVRNATASRSCLHRAHFVEPNRKETTGTDTLLRMSYESPPKVHYIRNWILNHPKIVIPALAAIIATITVAVFDPIRTWFIKAKITGALSLSEYEPVKWLQHYTTNILPFHRRHHQDGGPALLSERASAIDTLKSWLLDPSQTFIVVQGPRGSGKRQLVLEHVIPPRKNVLIIDCDSITEAHGDTAIIAAAARQVGYRPLFGWMNTISSLIDLAAQGTIGTSTGFSETLELQFSKILQNTAAALREIALQDRDLSGKDANLSDEEYLSAHPEKRPVVVIDNFLHSPQKTFIYDRLTSWAALLVNTGVAHVVFLTNDVSFSKPLSKPLPDRVLRSVLLGDASPQSAKQFVMNLLAEAGALPANALLFEEELDTSITILGGRLTDLEALATRIISGEGPSLAVAQIVNTSAAEIVKIYFSLGHQQDDPKFPRKWSAEQAWYLITLLTTASAAPKPDPGINTLSSPEGIEHGSIRYSSLLLHPLFKSPSGEESVQSLAHSDLINILTHPSGLGRPYAIRPGRPVYKAAFAKLLEDKVLKARMDLAVSSALVKIEEGNMKDLEEELALLTICGGGREAGKRMEYLGKKMGVSQAKVEGYELQMEVYKKLLEQNF